MSKKLWLLAGGMFVFLGSMAAFQRTFREYPGIEYNDFPVPPDYQHPAEFMFARLMYPPYTGQGGFGFGGFTVNSWQEVAPSGPRIIRAPTATFCALCGA